MNKLIVFLTSALLVLSAFSVSAADRDNRGNRGRENNRQNNSYDNNRGNDTRWNVNINLGSRNSSISRWNNNYGRSRFNNYNYYNNAYTNFSNNTRSGFYSQNNFGGLFTTGLIGNYSAVPDNNRFNPASRIYRGNNIIRYSTTSVDYGRSKNQRSLLKDSRGRCYELSYDRRGNEIRTRVSSRQCDF